MFFCLLEYLIMPRGQLGPSINYMDRFLGILFPLPFRESCHLAEPPPQQSTWFMDGPSSMYLIIVLITHFDLVFHSNFLMVFPTIKLRRQYLRY